MRNFIQTVARLFETIEGLNAEVVRSLLTQDYWRALERTPKYEIWEHLDDPDIGRFQLNLNSDGSLSEVHYISVLHPMFHREFDSFAQLKDHISTITNDPPDPETMAKASEKLKQIANNLRVGKH